MIEGNQLKRNQGDLGNENLASLTFIRVRLAHNDQAQRRGACRWCGASERFCEGNVYGTIGRYSVPQFRHARQKQIVRIPAEGKIGEAGNRRAFTLRVELASRRVPANDRRCHRMPRRSPATASAGRYPRHRPRRRKHRRGRGASQTGPRSPAGLHSSWRGSRANDVILAKWLHDRTWFTL